MKISEFYNRFTGHQIQFKAVTNELKEVLEVNSISELIDELSDVSFVFQCWLHQEIGLDWPMFWSKRPTIKMQDRLEKWIQIFDENGLIFHKRYWWAGSNYNREYKVKRALDKAREDQLNDKFG